MMPAAHQPSAHLVVVTPTSPYPQSFAPSSTQTFQTPNAVDTVLLSFTAFVGYQQFTEGAPFEYQALIWRYDPDSETVVDAPIYTGPVTTIPRSVPMLPDYASVTAFFDGGLELQAGV